MNPSRRRTVLLVLALPAVLAAAACVTRSAPGPEGMDPTLARSTYIEEGGLVALVVSSKPMSYRLDRPFIPVEIAVVNKGLSSLTLTRESFTLVDDRGREYPAVGRGELSRGYGSTDVDRRLGEAAPFVAHRYASYRLVPSNLTPGFDAPIQRDRLFIPRFGYILDFIYFPRPDGDLAGRALELVLRAPELPDPVFVRFVAKGR